MRTLIVFVVLVGSLFAQTVFTRVDHPVYGLLARLDARHIIQFNSEVKPLSRIAVAALLKQIDLSRDQLNSLELQELQFFKEEFALELGAPGNNGFSIPFILSTDKEVTESQSHRVTESQSHKVTESQSHKVTESQSHKVTESQSHKVTNEYSSLNTYHSSLNTYHNGQRATGNPQPTKERYWLFSYTDNQFAIRISPMFGFGVRNTSGKGNDIRWPGVNFFGYGSDWFGASFEYVDFGESGSNTDVKKKFTPISGAYVNNTKPNLFEYSDVKGSVSFNWKWGYISVIKDYQTWGHGQFGQVILSTKAPSFAQIRFHANPVSWFRFNYFQGWLNSLIYDSSAGFWSHTESVSPSYIMPYKDKYIVANLATVSILDEFDFSLGNAFVYGPNFRFETLIPFLYYKVMDHNTGRIAADDGNGMIFSDFKVRFPKDYLFYGSAYIDVINLRDLLNGRMDNQWFAFTVGAKRFNILLPNLDVSVEYTRVNPWNYENRNELASYKHLGYQLGHWIGQNADQLRFQVNYSRFRGLRHFVYVEWVRKGIEADIAIAYNKSKYGVVEFLQGPLRKDFRFGLETTWEPFQDLRLRGYYEYSSISDEDKLRTPQYLIGGQSAFGLVLSYGL
jgi:hypothetical protein